MSEPSRCGWRDGTKRWDREVAEQERDLHMEGAASWPRGWRGLCGGHVGGLQELQQLVADSQRGSGTSVLQPWEAGEGREAPLVLS